MTLAQNSRDGVYQTFPCATQLWMNADPGISSSEHIIHIALFRRPRRVTEWRAKVNMFAQGGDTSRSEGYQRKRNSPFSPASMDRQWMKMEIKTGQCC